MSSFDWTNPTVVRLLDRYTTLNRKCLPQDAEQSRVVREVAEYYAANYEGNFEFMLSMRKAFDTWHSLTIKQASATINCLLTEYKRNLSSPVVNKPAPTFVYPTATLPDLPAEITAHKVAEREASLKTLETSDKPLAQALAAMVRERDHIATIRELPIKGTCSRCGAVADVAYDTSLTPYCIDKAACEARRNTPVVPQCKNGTYTIVLDETGDYRTIKLTDAPDSYNKPQGTQIAAYLSGSDNEKNYTGFAFITGTRINVWSKFDAATSTPLTRALRVLLGADRDTQIDMGHAYAIESGACFICGRKLTVPASLHRGMGPVCAEKY